MNGGCTAPSAWVHAAGPKPLHGNVAAPKRGTIVKTLILGLAAAASLAAALPAAAQPIDAREHNQAVRVEQGVRSGALTPGEAFRLHRREARLHRVEAQVRFRMTAGSPPMPAGS